MDIRTGKTYSTREEALADGVPESALALFEFDGETKLENLKKLKFSKGSFKPVGADK